jgi:hypothetical protein
MIEKVLVYCCSNMGLSFVTDLFGHAREDGKYELRRGVALFGHLMDEKSTDGNPFDENFRDNFVSGIGLTSAEAFQDFEKNAKSMCDSLWG